MTEGPGNDGHAWEVCYKQKIRGDKGLFFIKTYRGKDRQYEKDSQIGKSPLPQPLGGDFCSQIESKNSQTWKKWEQKADYLDDTDRCLFPSEN